MTRILINMQCKRVLSQVARQQVARPGRVNIKRCLMWWNRLLCVNILKEIDTPKVVFGYPLFLMIDNFSL